MHSSSQMVRQILVLLFCLSASGYFSYHTLYGRYGLEVRTQLLERLHYLEIENAHLETIRSKLQNDVTLLSTEEPNRNLIEEIAIEVLGYVYPQDKVVFLP